MSANPIKRREASAAVDRLLAFEPIPYHEAVWQVRDACKAGADRAELIVLDLLRSGRVRRTRRGLVVIL
ncbi:MAG TPA: hypothetical protein VFL91_21240 [Thermomicrobiales bacterium]|nr:hypothetical protein [Thermomicrobiales bacterium]